MRRLLRIPEADPEPISLGTTPHILVIKLAGLGDLLLATPALRALRARYPGARLDLLTTPEAVPLVRDSPLLDHVYSLDATAIPNHQAARIRTLLSLLVGLRRQRYHAAVLLHHLTLPMGRLKHRALLTAVGARLTAGLDNGHGAFLDLRVPDQGFGARHEADYFLTVTEAIGVRSSDGDRGLYVGDLGWKDLALQAAPYMASETSSSIHTPPILSPQRRYGAGHRVVASAAARHVPLRREDGTARVALHAGSGVYSTARRWPAERYAELAQALHKEERAEIVLVGGPDEASLNQTISRLLGAPEWVYMVKTAEPRALGEVLGTCSLFVGNDSFPMHLAVAVGLPVVAVFGPSNARAWGPYAPMPEAAQRVRVVRRADLPCSPCLYRGRALGTPGGCPPRPCLVGLEVRPVLMAAKQLLWQRQRGFASTPVG